MKNRIVFLLLAVGLAPPVWAAGSCAVSNVTTTQIANTSGNRVADAGTVIVTLTCIGDASTGSYPSTTIPITGFYPSGTTLNAYNLTGYFLYQVARTPGVTQPTANYSVTITDAKSFALDLGLLTSNGSASAAQMTLISNTATNFPIVRSALTVSITGNSVASANIVLDLVFRTSSAGGVASSLNGGATTNALTVTTNPIRDLTRFVLVSAMTGANGTVGIGTTGASNPTFSWPVTGANWYDMRCTLPVTFAASATLKLQLYSVSGSVTVSSISLQTMGNTGATSAFQDLVTINGASLASTSPVTGAPGASATVTFDSQFLTSHAGNIGIQFVGNGVNNLTFLVGGECGLTQIN